MADSRFNSGIYSLNEFKEKSSLKLAPDAFVSFNNSYGHKIVSAAPPGASDYKTMGKVNTLDYRGGISSISMSTSVTPGAGTCSITIVCPQYEGMHENYYIEQDDGTKVPYFLPLMEVKLFMKGRFMPGSGLIQGGTENSPSNSPRYYPVFWGFVTDIAESYTGGITTFTLTCRDMLGWWEYQNVNIVVGTLNSNVGGQGVAATGTVFRYMSPWEIILNLFNEVGFDSFMYPATLKGNSQLPNVNPSHVLSSTGADGEKVTGSFETMKNNMSTYWDERFPFKRVVANALRKQDAENTLEMYGITSILDLSSQTFVTSVNNVATTKETNPDLAAKKKNEAMSEADGYKAADGARAPGNGVILMRANNLIDSQVTPEFGMLDKVMPYGNFAETGLSQDPEPTTESKLGIAAKVTNDIGYEFFLDTNGNFVFKPPFYNMDVSQTNTFTILPSDIISFNESFSSSLVVNAVDVTGPMIQNATAIHVSASHWDFASIAKYGFRYKSVQLPYGNNAKQLQALAVSEMSKANALTTTASLEIPLRPEVRLGYPVYISHSDSFYYVKGISHSITFGSSATTTLTLDSKRAKVRDSKGKIMRAYTYRTIESLEQAKVNADALTPEQVAQLNSNLAAKSKLNESGSQGAANTDQTTTDFQGAVNASVGLKDQFYAEAGFYQGLTNGLYLPIPSEAYYKSSNPSSSVVGSSITSGSNRTLNELTYFTADSVPYTDVNGYNHIGAFPFGATLELQEDFSLKDLTQLGVGNDSSAKFVSIGATDRMVSPEATPNNVATALDPSTPATKALVDAANNAGVGPSAVKDSRIVAAIAVAGVSIGASEKIELNTSQYTTIDGLRGQPSQQVRLDKSKLNTNTTAGPVVTPQSLRLR